MSLATIMLEQLGVARRIIEDGQEVVPAWRIMTPDGTFLIITRSDTANPEQREHVIALISRFMVWKMATSFVLTAETWVGADGEARHERLAALQRIKRGDPITFSNPMWLAKHHVDDRYFEMLPREEMDISAEDAAELARIFGKNGELPAEKLH